VRDDGSLAYLSQQVWSDRVMEVVYFTLAGLALYFVSDRILNLVELRRGERFEQRSLIFFGIILVLSLITFNLISYLNAGG